MKKYIPLLFMLAAPLAFAGKHFDKALELYKKGPSAATQVISELNLELKENPEDHEAHMLLAMTQRGMAKFDDSLATLDKLEKIHKKNGSLYPWLYMLRAENYYFKKDYKVTKKILDTYWAYFESSEDLKAKWQELSAAVEEALAGTKESNQAPKNEFWLEEEGNPEKENAVGAALAFLKNTVPDSTKYNIFIPLDKNEPEAVLTDSDIKPFVAPIAIEADWWMVLCLSQKSGIVPPVCIYLDKKQGALKGYLIGSTSAPEEEKNDQQPRPSQESRLPIKLGTIQPIRLSLDNNQGTINGYLIDSQTAGKPDDSKKAK
jgi:tetratricopeptide (TPR) repeat protein